MDRALLCASDVSQIIYVTGALLKKARIGGIFANNCDCDVSNPRHTGYIKYHDRHRMCASDVTGLCNWRITQDGSALNSTWSVSETIIL